MTAKAKNPYPDWRTSGRDLSLRFEIKASSSGLLVSSASTVTPVAIIAAALGDRAFCKQAGKIVSVYGITQEERVGHVENFLHGAQIGRVSKEHVAGKGSCRPRWDARRAK